MLGEWHWEAGTKSALGFFSSVGTDLPLALDCTIFVSITHVSFRAIYFTFFVARSKRNQTRSLLIYTHSWVNYVIPFKPNTCPLQIVSLNLRDALCLGFLISKHQG